MMHKTKIMNQDKSHKKVSLKPIGDALMPMAYFKRESRSWFNSVGGIFMMIVFGVIAYVHLLFVWYIIDYYQVGASQFYNSPLHLLMRLEGQIAIFLFSLEFILAIRARFIEKLFGGFDRVYKMHALVGRIGMMAAILHFVFLLLDYPLTISLLKEFVLPSPILSILWGQIALWSFIVLVALTVWIKIPYRFWLWTHKLFGVAFLISGFHVWQIQPEYANFDPYRTVFTVVWFLGMFAYIYKLVLYKFIAPHYKATVTKVTQRHDVVDLYLQVHSKKFDSRPGDFVFMGLTKPTHGLPKEQHPFSISGLYENNVVRLSIKDLGDFTHRVSELQIGDEITLYGPYGKFDDKLYTKKSDMVWIGGGIGIAPFTYMAQYFSSLPGSGENGSRKAILFHSVKDAKEPVYKEEFQKTHLSDPDFTYKIWDASQEGFLTAQHIADTLGGVEELRKRVVFMCGPLPMMHALSKQFLDMGLKPTQIVFEEFAFG